MAPCPLPTRLTSHPFSGCSLLSLLQSFILSETARLSKPFVVPRLQTCSWTIDKTSNPPLLRLCYRATCARSLNDDAQSILRTHEAHEHRATAFPPRRAHPACAPHSASCPFFPRNLHPRTNRPLAAPHKQPLASSLAVIQSGS